MMSRSQSSLGYLDAGREDPSTSGVSPGYHPPQSSSGPINLSGLVCNVRRTTGREPHPLVGATTTILGDKLYVFGGRVLSKSRPVLTSDLYELDLIRRHWTRIEPTGDVPRPRYFHSVCALGDNKLVCYGGMSPAPSSAKESTSNGTSGQDAQAEVVVMSDIHIFDVPSRTWTRVPATDSPQGRYAHCATILPSSAFFTSASAPLSAIHHNPASSNPHQGSIGVDIDGFGGAEMVVVGGQDSSNHYIEQISVFNLRSLKWTNTSVLGRSCGAYRSVVAPLVGMNVSDIGSAAADRDPQEPVEESQVEGCPMLIYSNYNFLDVKLELQVRLPDGRLIEKPMQSVASPPGLRFPNGSVINGNFVVSGTYLTSSKQEFALWALDLKTLTWGRIDAGGSVFGHGSWNRGVLWTRRNTFVVLGHRKRSLVEDYNQRRINFSHVCMVELEAFGLYNNPCRTSPTSGYISHSSPSVPASLQQKLAQLTSGGRPFSTAADELGKLAQMLPEMADMELQAVGGERIPVNSRILTRRWGPYFIQLLRESSDTGVSDSATLRTAIQAYPNRNSSITITPSVGPNSNYSNATTLVSNSSNPSKSLLANLEIPSAHSLAPASRPRVLYLPHTYLTLQVLVYYFYTSSLPPAGSPLCTPQILCSLLQLARPYQVDGLLEATVERLHQILDGRNAAAVFNAAAMAAGGGRGTGFTSGLGGTLEALNGAHAASESSSSAAPGTTTTNPSQNSLLTSDSSDTEHGTNSALSIASSGTGAAGGSSASASRGIPLRINTNLFSRSHHRRADRDREDSISNASTATSASSYDHSDSEFTGSESHSQPQSRSQSQPRRLRRDTDAQLRPNRQIWTGDLSSVIGLQKRGLRGLMEGRRLRERNAKPASTAGLVGVPAPPSATATATATVAGASAEHIMPAGV
ncbi:putative regulatory protein Ral2 [Aspergillus clavatus NRRL 1]|uniref:Regulatory protein Ral2, putative n=1 Tax=Aspergillus clavatus (strain ATCC 1007 / CBS 513.65 / DSM 816 / NCTC 3887 / NRRL 1 / QM 1276 / 107) TaxID=344612 RepID=A1CHG8_ASPCL|nr:regulatory protein Ral2, putative [Aspergillus clavatus NRRL 1]EAW10323.1 regulatory protein Ral2, putative [Aspergillus clavatus NRRL 1]